jgi:hypothetical protein
MKSLDFIPAFGRELGERLQEGIVRAGGAAPKIGGGLLKCLGGIKRLRGSFAQLGDV